MQEVTLSKWGNSLGLRLPKKILDEMNIKEGDILSFLTKDKTIIFEKKRTIKRYSLDNALNSFHSADEINEIDFGKPQGNEEW